MKTQRDKLNPNSQGYTNALLEDLDDKFQAILEATQPIPEMQKDLARLTDRVGATELRLDTWEGSIKLIPEMQKDLAKITDRISATEQRLDTWEDNIRLIPAIFEEVGSLRKDVDIFKEELKLLNNRHDQGLDALEQRLIAVEQRVR